MATRQPVIWAFSTSLLRESFESVAPTLGEVAEVHVFDKAFEDALRTVREQVEAGETVDAIVAAGANGGYLRARSAIPVVIVNPTTLDVLQALVRARRISTRIGVVNYRQTVAGLEEAMALLSDTLLEQRAYLTLEEARAHVADLAARGFGAIIGPGPICEIAAGMGLRSVLIFGPDSLRRAIRKAAWLFRMAQFEQDKSAYMQAALKHLDVGVLVVDTEERIQSVNPALQRLVGAAASEMVGRRLTTVAPDLSAARVIETGFEERDVIQRLGNAAVVTSRVPIREHGVLRGAILTCQEGSTIQRLERGLRSEHRPPLFVARYTLDALVGRSKPMERVRALSRRYARTDATVLITGESGTGKEMVAQGIHASSRRREGPCVAINCAAFPESLLESELFGYEEGAFTGSRRGGRPGLFEAAHTGTIFLDEVGDVPVTLQSRLLRVLQERQVLRLGSNVPTPIDVRVVAATHRDLREMVRRGEFREDLYFRLHILPIHLPPLRERGDDLALIAEELLKRALLRHGAPEMQRRALAAIAPHLRSYAWPGNVRELENVVERLALLFADPEAGHRPGEADLRAVVPELFDAHGGEQPSRTDLRAAREAQDLAHVRRVMEECNGNAARAARQLGISRSTLYRKLGTAR
ncbi:MAG TPA: propionate catabolism operon regulatory protein PrpR [Anaeromyxobacteraceae bacterium]|nr:propionate catabolism operon regulatory protein PrpR [Anaeromyxobacteraceae bacterium]